LSPTGPSTAGAHERESTFAQILSTLETLSPEEGGDLRTKQKTLVPGAGLGRLAYEISALGFTTIANEHSFYMSMAHRWALSLAADHDRRKVQHNLPALYSYYPFLNWWSHQRESGNVLRGVTVSRRPTLPARALTLCRRGGTLQSCSWMMMIMKGDPTTSSSPFVLHRHG